VIVESNSVLKFLHGFIFGPCLIREQRILNFKREFLIARLP